MLWARDLRGVGGGYRFSPPRNPVVEAFTFFFVLFILLSLLGKLSPPPLRDLNPRWEELFFASFLPSSSLSLCAKFGNSVRPMELHGGLWHVCKMWSFTFLWRDCGLHGALCIFYEWQRRRRGRRERGLVKQMSLQLLWGCFIYFFFLLLKRHATKSRFSDLTCAKASFSITNPQL